jgi:hypothetical protein
LLIVQNICVLAVTVNILLLILDIGWQYLIWKIPTVVLSASEYLSPMKLVNEDFFKTLKQISFSALLIETTVCKNVFDVWSLLKFQVMASWLEYFSLMIGLGKAKVLSQRCHLILSNNQLCWGVGTSLKAPIFVFTERRHVRREHTGKIVLTLPQ